MRPLGSIVIPAHNEAEVIGRTLYSLAPGVRAGELEVLVVCNGCTDDTADIARQYPGIKVVEIPVGSKVLALRVGDKAASSFPRVYLDADIEVSHESIAHVLRGLDSGHHHAGRPPFVYELTHTSALVSRYFRARARMPSLNSALWGAGIYGLSAAGRQRFGEFPDVVGDDLFVDGLFDRWEITIFDCAPAIVRVPRTAKALVGVLGRVYSGQDELRTGFTRQQTARELETVAASSLQGAIDAAVYLVFVLWARMRRNETVWATDSTSRAK